MSYYKRNLPHYHPDGYAFFITTRLLGTIPKNIYTKIKLEFDEELKKVASYQDEKTKREKYSELQKYNFVKYENILDSCKYGHKWLGDERVANVVKDALHHRDKDLYDLIAYTTMPNHIHIVFKPNVERISDSPLYNNNPTIIYRYLDCHSGSCFLRYRNLQLNVEDSGIASKKPCQTGITYLVYCIF